MSLWGAVISIAIVALATIIVVNLATPMIDQGKGSTDIAMSKETMSRLSNILSELKQETVGAKRTVKIETNDEFIVSGKEDVFKLRLDPEIKIYEPGTRIKQGDIIISTGPYVSAYESDIDNDGATDIVLENEAVLFSVRKTGNSSFYQSLNTSNIITMIRNKKNDISVVPESGIYIDNEADYGNGYTELTVYGNAISSASIRVVMNSTFRYEALFTLGAGRDFIEMEVRNIE
ncbi:MAG: hypothetical protein J4473_05430 [Candidatus Aenigmarchaeota archaeon]|nr:hypothetical protein [Candidatus Aenigmarchaeota archaeon]